jgi:hypothetical protein
MISAVPIAVFVPYDLSLLLVLGWNELAYPVFAFVLRFQNVGSGFKTIPQVLFVQG